jgi:hypothetical protein
MEIRDARRNTQVTRREAVAGALGCSAALASSPGAKMPTVAFGPAKISRLIVGGNPVSGTSHWTAELSREMVDYFTGENIKGLLRGCERAGVNTWQARGDRHILRLLHEYRQGGGSIHWIAQTATEIAWQRNFSDMLAERPLGMYHHGSNTDALWQAGKIDSVRDTLKQIRQSGIQVGLGTHIPEVIDYVESKDWDLDFYLTCVYNPGRSQEEKTRLVGPNPPAELFWDADRPEMLKRVRQTRRQCLIFKVYGATRHCDSRERMLGALKLVFQYAKPQDAVVIGMFQKYKDQVAENCQLLLEALQSAS